MKNKPHSNRFKIVPFLCAFSLGQIASWASGDLIPLCQMEPGPIGIASTRNPARYSFDQPNGQAGSASEGAGNAVASILNTPNLGHPQLEAAVGILEFVASPFAAGYGALKEGGRKLTSDQLAWTEQAVDNVMSQMAAQDPFRDLVIATARTRTHRSLLEVISTDVTRVNQSHFSGLLQVQVENLRLHRLRNTDKSFRLEILARARLIRKSDGAILYDKPLRYDSGEALFVDWARQGGLANVTRTGYQILAQQVAAEVFGVPANETLYLGEEPKRKARGVAAHVPLYTRKSWSPVVRVAASQPGLQFVEYRSPAPEEIEILPDLSSRDFHIQGLTTSSEPATGTMTDTEYALDGLETHRNFVVQIAGCIGAIPLGLWEHTVGSARQGSDQAVQAADTILKASSAKLPSRDCLSLEVARSLAQQGSDGVLYNSANSVDEKLPASAELGEGIAIKSGADHPEFRLEILVVNSSLTGKSGRHPRLRLALEIEATVLRSSDGQELSRWPVCYVSTPRRLTDWAAQDALRLRQELTSAYRVISQALAHEVIAGGFARPARNASSTVAAN